MKEEKCESCVGGEGVSSRHICARLRPELGTQEARRHGGQQSQQAIGRRDKKDRGRGGGGGGEEWRRW